MANFVTTFILLVCHILRQGGIVQEPPRATISRVEESAADKNNAAKETDSGDRRVSKAEFAQLRKAMDSLKTDAALAAKLAGELAGSAEPLPDRVLATVLWIQGSGLAISEQYEHALEVLDHAEKLARQISDDKLLRRILRYKSAAACECSEYTVGRDAAIEAIRLSESMKDTTAYVATLHSELASNESALGNKETAIEHLQTAVEISYRCNDRKGQSQWLVNAACLMSELGQHQQAIDSYQRVLKLESGETENLAVAAAHRGLGEALIEIGLLPDAETHLQTALLLCKQPGAESIRGSVEASLGKLFIVRSDLGLAQHHFLNSLVIFKDLGNTPGIIAAEQALRKLEGSADLTADIFNIREQLVQAEESNDLELQVALHKELSQKLGVANQWHESSTHATRADVLGQQLASARFNDKIARLLSEMSHREKRQAIEDLQDEVSAREKLIVAQWRLNIGLVGCIGLMFVVMLVIFMLLQSKRRAVRELRAAQHTLREQKLVQSNMERRLADQQKTQSLALMASGIAHDFNNLLAGIAGLAELATMSLAVDRKNELLQQITETSLQASGLTGQLMQFLGKPRNESVQCNVADVIESTKGLLQSVARPNVLSLEGAVEPCFAEIDETRLRQVLVNLVSNAAEASESEGQISVGIDSPDLSKGDLLHMNCDAELQPGEYCRIRVVDSGHGISAETKAHLFDPYFSTKAMGRGLGLSSVIGIVRSCRGFVFVESEPGHGCCFSVFLKCSDSPVAAATAPPEMQPTSQPEVSSGFVPRVLMVDDEQMLLDMQTEYLTMCGFRVFTARSAEEALSLAAENGMQFDCAVTDFCMGGKDGKWLAAQLRLSAPNLPIIMCSGFSGGAIEFGREVSKVLSKPYSPQALVKLINECIGAQNSAAISECNQPPVK